MPPRITTFLLATAMLGTLLVGACREPSPEGYQVRVTSIDAHGGPALAEDRVRGILRRSLERAPSFSPAERDQRSGGRGQTLVASLEYREIPDASDHGRDLLVRLVVERPEDLDERLSEAGLDATVLLERAAGEADLAADLQIAVDRLATIIQARTDLAAEREGAVAELLAARDPELVILTLEWVRDHPRRPPARQVADRVAELINHDDERVGLLAIETIGEIGGPEHVSALLDRIQLADASQVSRAYDALARLGGPEAEGFLKFAARNEEEPERRAAAERALRRVAEAERGPQRSSELPRSSRGHR